MPYSWDHNEDTVLTLWPHQSLPPEGFAAFILVTFALICLPLVMVLGSTLLWGLIPFAMAAVWGIYFALRKNQAAQQISEELRISDDDVVLQRRTRKTQQEWRCNRYWVRVTKYKDEGPVPDYLTLRGNGREVEIGAFLSEQERLTLYDELKREINP